MKLPVFIFLIFSVTVHGQSSALGFNDSNEVMKKNLLLGPQFLESTTKLQLEAQNITDSWNEDGVKLAMTYRSCNKSWGTIQHRIGWARNQYFRHSDYYIGIPMGQHAKNQTNLNNQISVNMNSGISVGLYHGFFATNNYSGIDDEIFQRNEFRSDTLIIGIRRKWKNLLGTMITAGRTFTKGNYRLEDRVTFSVPHILEIDRKFNDKWLLRMGLSIGNVVLGFERAFYGYAVDPDDYFYRYLRYSTFKSFLHYSGRHFSIQAEDIDGETMFIAQTRKLYIDHLRTKYGVSPFVAGEVIITGGREYQYSAAISTNIQTGINAILLKNRLNIDIVYEWIPYDHQPYLTFNLLVNVL